MSSDFVSLPPFSPFLPAQLIDGVIDGVGALNFYNGQAGVFCLTNIDVSAPSPLTEALVYASVSGTGFWSDDQLSLPGTSVHLYFSWRGLRWITQGQTLTVQQVSPSNLGWSATGWYLPLTAWEA